MAEAVEMANVPVWSFADGMKEETAPATPECPDPSRWTQMNDVAPEVEVLKFLQQWVRTTKPQHVVVSGDLTGYITIYIAQALRENGFGVVASIWIPSEYVQEIAHTMGQSGLDRWIEFAPAEPEVSDGIADMLFLDRKGSEGRSPLGCAEGWLKPGGVMFVHDVSDSKVRNVVKQNCNLPSMYLPTPRGLLVFQK